jgi:hypothetical protein
MVLENDGLVVLQASRVQIWPSNHGANGVFGTVPNVLTIDGSDWP